MFSIKKDFKGISLAVIFFIFAFFPVASMANGLAVSNVSIVSQNETNQTANVQFDITWNNSWRNAINYDAAWVFVKFSTDHGVTWNHATLAATGGSTVSDGGTGGVLNPTGYSLGSGTGLQIIVPTEASSGYKGAFLQRASNGEGTLNTTGVQLVWNWAADGLTATTPARVKVFAIEMVYIPTASFYVGTPTANIHSLDWPFYEYGTNNPYQITSEGPITIGTSNGDLYYNSTFGGDQTGTLPDNTTSGTGFPKGYEAFYRMKYDITQGEYRDFLNTLTRNQQATRVATNIATGVTTVGGVYVMNDDTTTYSRSGIRVISPIPSTGPVTFGCDVNNTGTLNGSNDGEWIAANFLDWADVIAYAAWTGLRPFTELEYEKAARGPNAVVDGEYAWGSTVIARPTGINNSGQNNEVASNAGANAAYDNSGGTGTFGPFRVGMFASTATTRVQAGAGYYGNMDLSGNVTKFAVTVGNAQGRAFIGSHGTGVLSVAGDATNTDWPSPTTAVGSGLRGGTFNNNVQYLSIADRGFAASALPNRNTPYGGRVARTSP